MSKAMTIAGLVVAVLVFAALLLDMFIGGTGWNAMHIGGLFAAAILGYLSFSTFREQK